MGFLVRFQALRQGTLHHCVACVHPLDVWIACTEVDVISMNGLRMWRVDSSRCTVRMGRLCLIVADLTQ